MTRTTTTTTTRARRFSPLAAVATAALLLGGGYVGATALFSSRAQDTTQEAVQQLTDGLQATGKVKVEKSEYRKGFSDSTQTLTLAIQDTAAATGEPLRVIVTNHIKHGPVLGAAGMGQALVDTDIRFADPKVQAELDKAFGGQKPTIRTLVGMTGTSTTDINVPSGKFTAEDQPGELTWQPLKGQVQVAGLKTVTDLNWPGLVLKSPDSNGMVGAMKLSSTMTRENKDDPFGTGQATLTLDNVVLEGRQPVTLRGLKMSSDSQRSGEFQNLGVRYEIAEMAAQGQNLKNMQLALKFDHLARDPLERLSKLFQEVSNQNGASGTTPDLTEAQQKQAQDDVLALLRGQPVLRLERLSLGEPGRDMVMVGEASLPGASQLSAADLQGLAGPQVMGLLQADLKLTTSEAALSELSSSFGGSVPDVQTLVDSGTFQREGSQLVTTFSLKDGQMLVNGKPMQ